MRGLLFILCLLCACAQRTPEELCADTCAFYSECNPSIRPLEETCRMACLERFADPMRIVATCETPDRRHAVDQYQNLPSLQSSAIDVGECRLDQGCPPDKPWEDPGEDPCAGIEMICLDMLDAQQRCWRDVQVDRHRCDTGYRACLGAGSDQSACLATLQSCYQQANANGSRCS